MDTSVTRNAVVATGKKLSLFFYPVATTEFIAIVGGKCVVILEIKVFTYNG